MHLPRRYGRLALALVVSAFAAPDLAAQYTPKVVEPTPEVADVVFEGLTKAVDKKELQLSIYTEPTRCRSLVLVPFCKFLPYRGFTERHYLDRQEFKRDVLRIRVFYFREGYRDTQVDTSVVKLDAKKVKIVFRITEGPPTVVTNVNIAYDSTIISAKKVRDLTLVEVGRPYDLFEIDSTRIQFQNELWEQGYADALIDTSSVIDEVAHTARVTIRLVPNRLTTVGNIAVQGTEKVTPRTVLNSLGFREGDLFRRSALLESQRNLYESNLFKLAALEVPQSFDSVKAVNVVVREAPLREARIGGGFNTVDFLQAEYRFTNYNLFGGGRRFDISAAAGNLGANSLNGVGLFREVPVDSFTTRQFRRLPAAHVAGEHRAQATGIPPAATQCAGDQCVRAAARSAIRGDRSRLRRHPHVHTHVGVSCTGELVVSLRGDACGSERPVLLRELRCLRYDDDQCVARTPEALAGAVADADRSLGPTAQPDAWVHRAGGARECVGGHVVRLSLQPRVRRWFALHAVGTEGRCARDAPAHRVRTSAAREVGEYRRRSRCCIRESSAFYAGGSQSVRGYGENQLGPRILTLPRGEFVNAFLQGGGKCDITSDAIALCDPNTLRDADNKLLPNSAFTPRPLGGTSLIEGSVEYRFPIVLPRESRWRRWSSRRCGRG